MTRSAHFGRIGPGRVVARVSPGGWGVPARRWDGRGTLGGSMYASCRGGPVAQPTTPVTPPDPHLGAVATGEPAPPTPTATTPAQDATLLERALFEVKRVIVAQDRMFVALLSRGHCLLEGVPSVAKTLAVETLARVAGGTFSRIQFTPDLVPADIVGTRIYRQSSEKFDVELGPVF